MDIRLLVTITERLRGFLAASDTDSLYCQAVELGRERLRLDRCALYIKDGGRFRGTYGSDGHGKPIDQHSIEFPQDALSRPGATEKVGSSGLKWFVLEKDLFEWNGKEAASVGRGWACVTPILVSDECVGLFYNDSVHRKAEYDETMQEWVAYYCLLLGYVINRKRFETQLKETERALKSANEELQQIMASISDYLWSAEIDAKGHFRYRYYSPVIETVTGRPSEFYMPGPARWLSTVHPDDRLRMERVVHRILSLHSSREEGEYRIVRPDGTIRWVRDSVMARPRPEGGAYIDGVVSDITERKHAEENLQETNKRLEDTLAELRATQTRVFEKQRLNALGVMASGIANDFNNALTGIVGFSELLLLHPKELENKDKVQRYLQLILNQAEDAAKTVNRLAAFYRKKEEREVFVPVDINQIVEQTVEISQPMWRDQAMSRGITVKIDKDLRKIPPVPGRESELRQALTNLILNAVEALQENGTVTFRTRVEDDRVVLELSDTGQGMTEDVRRHCMDPFFTTKTGRGAGLGLSGVYGIVQRHHGTMDIESQLGKGTTVRLRLPRQEPTAEPPPTVSTPIGSIPPLRILIVDDEQVVRDVIAQFLTFDGHAVQTASDGQEGLNLFRTAHFDVVFTDRAMPVMNGDQMAKAIDEIAPDVPIIQMTGFGAMMQAREEKPAGVDLVLSKPVTLDMLRKALACVLKLGPKP